MQRIKWIIYRAQVCYYLHKWSAMTWRDAWVYSRGFNDGYFSEPEDWRLPAWEAVQTDMSYWEG